MWPGVGNLELYKCVQFQTTKHKRKVRWRHYRNLSVSPTRGILHNLSLFQVRERLKSFVKDECAVDLIEKLLILDPSQRIDADTALNHDFFWSDPMPADIAKTLALHTQSMFEYFAKPGSGRNGQRRLPYQRPSVNASSTSNAFIDTGYQDRIY